MALKPIPEKTLIAVLGPTAVGKTKLAINIASNYRTEIISADARQCFREITIGTAKPNVSDLTRVKHHFINSHSIIEEFSAGGFERESMEVLNRIFQTKNVAVVVGGSGLYVNALCSGFNPLPNPKRGVREALNQEYRQYGLHALQEQLHRADPVYYEKVDINNPQRLIRALEVWRSTGKPFSSYQAQAVKERPFGILKIGLYLDKDELTKRIDQRVDEMMHSGLLEEVKNLLPHHPLNSLKTVGYSELFDYFSEKTSLEQAIDLIKKHTWQYAKRQMTWFKKDQAIQWFHAGEGHQEKVLSFLLKRLPRAYFG